MAASLPGATQTQAVVSRTDAQVQLATERARMKNPLSLAGFAASFRRGSLGVVGSAPVSGVTLGV